jgi:hypothetical protein
MALMINIKGFDDRRHMIGEGSGPSKLAAFDGGRRPITKTLWRPHAQRPGKRWLEETAG